jgi:elongation factor Tu
VLTQKEGGRHTPFSNNYYPCFYVHTVDIPGRIKLPDGVERVMLGDNIEIEVELITSVAMAIGVRLAIREGGRTTCVGICTKVGN